MELSGARVLVAGATGVLGGAITTEPADRGAGVAPAGRDRGRLANAARACPGTPTVGFDAHNPESCARVVHGVSAALGRPDAVVVAFRAVAFGAVTEVGDEVAGRLMAVEHLAPAVFFRAALGILQPGSAVAAVTGLVAERPQPRTADFSASTAASTAWPTAVRREAPSTGVAVPEIRPAHPGAGSVDRSVMGIAPPPPEGGDLRQVAGAVAPEADGGLLRPGRDGSSVVERRAR